ncbi:cysteine--tRNA ligase [Paracoccus seriniphilus]|uniref:Cysteine--tRNA ligase n=1 Tax=Paracoccus seriniphilus TaxID=184748 RepID=A0A239Q2C7_9RHOB|nr:cysteine--tRNA ligase [Paracoccus seriniphilus]WCR13266.1 cysteine--tRNA ligase [Paracoccus seriniphilus]SNT76468.1 cysteinyl-tRNA synthetase [Paracoccus seriniphilus]
MVEIRLTNTRTRKKEIFEPLDPRNVRLYLCGPTVYDRAHLGNARPVLVFDVLVRLLRHVYGDSHVTYVRNFTDVDDKINARAAATGRSIRDITEETIGWYHADMDALGAERPDHEPRATDYITQMIAMIENLITRRHAYVAEGHVLFDVRSYSEYGRLSGRSVDDMIAGARVEVAPFKRDPMDFVLWKPSAPDQPGWDSPWGRGRPGWHIECSAMSAALLGPTFDIHGGGIDLQFPHHENEVAQSCCAHPDGDFARFWLHNEMLQVEGKKMSKSLGNFFTVRDLLDKGVPGEVIRFVMLSTHYRKPMDWTEAKASEAEAVLRRWRGLVAGIEPAPSPAPSVVEALCDDLNTAGAMAALHDLAGKGDLPGLLASANLMGLLLPTMGKWAAVDESASAVIESLLNARSEARKARDFARADAIRDGFAAAGVEVKDTAAGAEWALTPGFDSDRLDELARNYAS